MTKNQKIALGCGGAGCLGLIFLVVVGCVIYFLQQKGTFGRSERNTNFNFNSNRNSNSTSNANEESTTSTTTMSEDDQHKLFQAAAGTNDSEIMHRVWTKLGLMSDNSALNEKYSEFARSHIGWLFRNADFLKEIDTPEKAREYVDAHIDD
jgi:hypothetical protein